MRKIILFILMTAICLSAASAAQTFKFWYPSWGNTYVTLNYTNLCFNSSNPATCINNTGGFSGTSYDDANVRSSIINNVTNANASMKAYVDANEKVNTTAEVRAVFGNSSNITYDASTGIFYYNGSSGGTYDDTNLKTWITNNVTNANISMKAYVDAVILLIRASIGLNVTDANTSMKTYVDAQNVLIRTSIGNNITNANASIKAYVDAQDTAIRASIGDNATSLNNSVKSYVYNGSLQLNITRQFCSGDEVFYGFDSGTFSCKSGSGYDDTNIRQSILNNVSFQNSSNITYDASTRTFSFNGTITALSYNDANVRESIVNNDTVVRTSILNNITNANTSMKLYSDAQDVLIRSSIINNVSFQNSSNITYDASTRTFSFNGSITASSYNDANVRESIINNDTLIRASIINNITNANASMKVYVDAQGVLFRAAAVNNVTNANTSMKAYVDANEKVNTTTEIWAIIYNGTMASKQYVIDANTSLKAYVDANEKVNTTVEIRAVFSSSDNISYNPSTGKFEFNGTTLSYNDGNVRSSIGTNITNLNNTLIHWWNTSWVTTNQGYNTSSELITNLNLQDIRNSIGLNITDGNTSMKAYVDAIILLVRTSIGLNVTDANASMKIYVDANEKVNTTAEIRAVFGNSSNITYNSATGIFEFNGSTSSYDDANVRESIINNDTAVRSSIGTNITNANDSMKTYVDNLPDLNNYTTALGFTQANQYYVNLSLQRNGMDVLKTSFYTMSIYINASNLWDGIVPTERLSTLIAYDADVQSARDSIINNVSFTNSSNITYDAATRSFYFNGTTSSYNDANVRESIINNVTNANTSMKAYVDAIDILLRESINLNITWFSGQIDTRITNNITNANNSMKLYVDAQDILIRTSIANNITDANNSMKAYVDAQDTLVRTSIGNNLTAFNQSIIYSYNVTNYLNTSYQMFNAINNDSFMNRTVNFNISSTTGNAVTKGNITAKALLFNASVDYGITTNSTGCIIIQAGTTKVAICP